MIKQLLEQLFGLFRWFLLVTPWEQAIRVRAGKHVRLLRAGMYLRIPLLDRVYRQSVRRRLTTIPPQTLTTRDGKAVTVGSCIGYEIVDLLRLYQSLHDAEDTIASEASAMIADCVKTHDLDELEAALPVQLELEKYGLGGVELFVTNFAAVRTYRLITGDIPAWQRGKPLDVTSYDGEPKD